MKGAILILVFLIVTGIWLWVYDILFWKPRHRNELANQDLPEGETQGEPQPESQSAAETSVEGTPASEGICCGLHAVCEKTSLSPLGTEAEYYDDEELDRFRGRAATGYTPEESEEFREVMMTMRPEEVAGWSRSLQVRGIELPEDVREELLMIVGDLRQGHTG